MKNIDWNKIWPHALAVAVFAILTAIYFYPALQGKKVKMEDMNRYQGMSQEAKIVKELDGDYPLWTNSMFGGMPTYQITGVGATNNLNYADSLFSGGFPYEIGYFFICFISFYILTMILSVKPIIGIVGSIAYAFSSYFIIIIQAGHVTKLHTIAYIPAIVGAVILAYRGRRLLGGSLFALFMGLELKSNHLQITYYLLFILLAIFLYEVVKQVIQKKEIKNFLLSSGALLAGLLLAIGSNSTNLWTTYDYSKHTTRGPSELTAAPDGKEVSKKENGLDFEYITNWSYGPGESFTLLIPNAKGGASAYLADNELMQDENISQQTKQNLNMLYQNFRFPVSKYWGPQPFTSGPVYVGAIVFLLFILGMVFIRSSIKWWILGVSVLALFLSWGKYFPALTTFFIDNFPMYNKFRAVTMILVIVEFSLPFLAVLYLKELYENKKEHLEKIKYFYITGGALAFILLLFLALPTAFFDFFSEQELQQFNSIAQSQQGQINIGAIKTSILDLRLSAFRADAGRSLVFVLLGFGLIFLYLKGKIKFYILGILLALFITIDLVPINKRYLNNEKDERTGKYIHWVDKDKFQYPVSISKADHTIYKQENNEKTAALESELLNKAKSKSGNEPLGNNQMNALKMGALNLSSNYRVLKLGNPFNDSYTSNFHKSIGGYHGAKLKRFQQLVDFHLSTEYQTMVNQLNTVRSLEDFNKLTENLHIINMFNTKYIIIDQGRVWPNNNANGMAWFPTEVVWANSPDEEIKKIGEIDTKKQVIVPQKYEQDLSKELFNGSGSVELINYHPEHISYNVAAQQETFAVFSEIYYEDGWNAYIDGNLVPHYQVNFLLRGLKVPQGDHKVEFKFEPESISTVRTLNFAFSGLIILLVIASIFFEWKKKNSQVEQ